MKKPTPFEKSKKDKETSGFKEGSKKEKKFDKVQSKGMPPAKGGKKK